MRYRKENGVWKETTPIGATKAEVNEIKQELSDKVNEISTTSELKAMPFIFQGKKEYTLSITDKGIKESKLDEALATKINETKESLTKKQDAIPSYTKDEYLAIRDTLPNGTKVCITDDYIGKKLIAVSFKNKTSDATYGLVDLGIPASGHYIVSVTDIDGSLFLPWNGLKSGTNTWYAKCLDVNMNARKNYTCDLYVLYVTN